MDFVYSRSFGNLFCTLCLTPFIPLQAIHWPLGNRSYGLQRLYKGKGRGKRPFVSYGPTTIQQYVGGGAEPSQHQEGMQDPTTCTEGHREGDPLHQEYAEHLDYDPEPNQAWAYDKRR